MLKKYFQYRLNVVFVVNSHGSGADCKRIPCESTMSQCCFCTSYTDRIRTADGACVNQALEGTLRGRPVFKVARRAGQ